MRSLSSFFFILLLTFSFLSISLCGPFTQTVSAFMEPDDGYETHTTMIYFNVDEFHTFSAVGTETTPWNTLVSMHPGNTWDDWSSSSGWMHAAPGHLRVVFRSVFWFNTDVGSEMELINVSFSVKGTESHSTGRSDTYKLCEVTQITGDDPIPDHDAYYEESLISTTEFHATGAWETVDVPTSYINLEGHTIFMIRSDDDYDNNIPGFGSSIDKCVATWSQVRLTISYKVHPAYLADAGPRNYEVEEPCPLLWAAVQSYAGPSHTTYVKIFSKATGAWSCRKNYTLYNYDTLLIGYTDNEATSDGTYYWSVNSTISGTSNIWHNYTFVYVIGDGGNPTYKVELPDGSSYTEHDIFTLRTICPTDPVEHGWNWFAYIEDGNGTRVIGLLQMGNDQGYQVRGVGVSETEETLELGDYVTGSWTVNLAVRIGGTYYQLVDAVQMTVSSYTSGYQVYPSSSKGVFENNFIDTQQVGYTIISPVADEDYWLSVCQQGSTEVRNISVNIGAETQYFAKMAPLPNGTYYFSLLNKTTFAVLDNSGVFSVNPTSYAINSYKILGLKENYLNGENIEFDTWRWAGVDPYHVVVIRKNGGETVFYRTGIDSSRYVEVTCPGQTVMGDYIIYVYTGTFYTDDPNYLWKQFHVYAEGVDPDKPPVVEGFGDYAPYVGIGVFIGLLGLGAIMSIKMQSPIPLPTVLFGGMMVFAIPGTFLCVLPLWVAFLAGVALLLILFLMMRR